MRCWYFAVLMASAGMITGEKSMGDVKLVDFFNLWGPGEKAEAGNANADAIWTQKDRELPLFDLNGTCWKWYDRSDQKLFSFCPFQDVRVSKWLRYDFDSDRVNLGKEKSLGVWRGNWVSERLQVYESASTCKSSKHSSGTKKKGPSRVFVEYLCPEDLGSPETHTSVIKVHKDDACTYQLQFRSMLVCKMPTLECNQAALNRCVHSQFNLREQVKSLKSLVVATQETMKGSSELINEFRRHIKSDPVLVEIFGTEI